MKLLRRKKFVIPAIVGAVALAGAGIAYGFFTSTGSGTGSAVIGDPSALTVVVGTPTGGTLFPTSFTDGNAVVDTVPYTVTNGGEGNVALTSVVMEVTPGFNYVDPAGDPACTAADFSINGQAVGTPVATGVGVTLNGLSDAPANAYSGSLTLQLVDNGANQDSCAGGSVPLTVTADPNLLSDIAYFTETVPSPFTRSLTPIVSAPVDQSVTAAPSVTLSIAGATGYADNGFYINLGTLGKLSGYTIQATGSSSQFGTNLYFNTNPPGNDFFNWTAANTYTTVPGNTSYILGPSSAGGTITVTESSGTFVSPQNTTCSVSPVTLADLQAGDCSGIGPSTPIAVWVGDTLGGGGTDSTTFTSVTAS